MTVKVPTNNIGAKLLEEPSKDWYLRRDSNDSWFGPLTFREADDQARRMTYDGTVENVMYAQLGTFVGTRGGDPSMDPSVLFVVYIYANGKLFLRGRQAEFHKDKL